MCSSDLANNFIQDGSPSSFQKNQTDKSRSYADNSQCVEPDLEVPSVLEDAVDSFRIYDSNHKGDRKPHDFVEIDEYSVASGLPVTGYVDMFENQQVDNLQGRLDSIHEFEGTR